MAPLKKNKTPVECPFCQEKVLALDFPNHCSIQHDIPSFQCAWCLGHFHHAPLLKDTHTSQCSKSFIEKQSLFLMPYSKEPVLMDMQNACEMGTDFEPIHEMIPSLSGVTFQNDHLNLAVACVQWFLKSKDPWYHVMVRPAFYSAFAKTDSFHTLPFKCFCKGEGTPHQHLIIVGPFRLKGIKSQKIESPLHLVDVLGYVSQTRSLCDFTFSKAHVDPRGSNHSSVARPLPLLSPFILTMLWEGGLRAWIDRMMALLHPGMLEPAAFASHDKWIVCLSGLFGEDNQVLLPVSKHFQRCLGETAHVLYVLDGKRWYFTENQENGDPMALTLSELIGDALYHPTPAQQTCLGLVKPYKEYSEHWEEKARAKEADYEMLEYGIGKWKKEKQMWKRKWQQGAKEFKQLQYKHILLLEQENTYWRMKHESRKQK